MVDYIIKHKSRRHLTSCSPNASQEDWRVFWWYIKLLVWVYFNVIVLIVNLCKTSDCAGWGGIKLKSANGQDWKIIEKWYQKFYDIIDFFWKCVCVLNLTIHMERQLGSALESSSSYENWDKIYLILEILSLVISTWQSVKWL